MRIVFLLAILFSVSISSAQISKYLRKGTKSLEKNKIEKARINFSKAYAIDKTSYEANVGLGYVLSECEFKYEEALPYLETAYAKSPVDTFPDLLFALAKCYQYKGENKKASALFNNLIVKASQDPVQDKIYMLDLKKRQEDCVFAENNKSILLDKNIYVGNLGSKINTNAGEYVPVMINNDLLFTSRRKDFEKEKKSKIDDKYFENIYSSKIENGRPQSVKTYTIDKTILKTKPRKSHLSIISSSNDGKMMYVFQKNKIFEINTQIENKKEIVALSKNVNIDYYQNHAVQSKDGKLLLFTSEDERGNGGLDIYKATKQADGSWGQPENLGKTINTELDEDAPFLSDDGNTLYFSSKGHNGFGNYDVYKSDYKNGAWSSPENMKQPINSSGNDIFLMQTPNKENTYFSSQRPNGFGDMDIYKITYLDKFKKECPEKTNSLLALNAKIADKDLLAVKFEAELPSNLNVIAYQWMFNQTKLPVDASQITQTISLTSPGDSVNLKVIAGCDTCIEPVVLCSNLVYKLPEDLIPKKTDDIGKNPYDDQLVLAYLNPTQIAALGFNITPIHFNLNKSNIRKDADALLKTNLEVLSKHPELSILIYGFADSRGKEEYNLPLSEKRANKVKQFLISKGLNAKQIEQVNGKGEDFILNKCTEGVSCEDQEHEVNRRVEFILFEKK